MVPLVAVSTICVVEAVVIAFLLGRDSPAGQVSQGGAAVAPWSPGQTVASSSPAPSPPPAQGPPPAFANNPPGGDGNPPAAGAAVVRGKVGQRVASAGLAITVVGVTNEPRYKEVTAPPASQKFVGVEVLIENIGDQGHQYFSTSFKIKDPQDRTYASGGLGVGEPPLDWGTIVQGEKVRGHIAFVVPKDATGLTLAYMPPGGGPAGYRPIHIELGQ